MAFILPDSTRTLSRDYGGIFHEPITGCVFAIPRLSSNQYRKIYLIDDDSETDTSISLDFANLITDYGLPKNVLVTSASLYDGKYYVLVERPYKVQGWPGLISSVSVWGSDGTFEKFIDIMAGIVGFCVNASPDFAGKEQMFFPSLNFIARYDTNYTQTNPFNRLDFVVAETPAVALGIQTIDSTDYLVVCYGTGRLLWLDISDWDVSSRLTKNYKEFGVFGARAITDIAIDDTNNFLYILDRYNKFLTVKLEPFGDESSSYINTPHTIEIDVDKTLLNPGQETDISAIFQDMWGQNIIAEGLTAEFISGAGLGEVYNPDDKTWGLRQRILTDSTGYAITKYRAKEV